MLVSGEYPPIVGGLADYTCKLGKGLAELGWQVNPVTVGTGTAGSGHDRAHLLARSWGWRAAAGALGLARRARVDVVSLQYQTGCYRMHPSVNLLPVALKRLRVPCVTTFHDFRTPYLFPKAGLLRRWINALMAASSSLVVLVDPADLAVMPARASGRARLVPIASNIEPTWPVDTEVRRDRFGYRLLFFGLANWSKGLDLAIATLGKLVEWAPTHPWHLRIVGGGIGTDPTNRVYKQRCLDLIAELGIQKRVSFAGEVPPHKVTEELLQADVAVLPYRDGISYRRGSLLACLAHGLPVVTAGPIPGTVPEGWPSFQDGHNVAVCLEPEPEALAAWVLRLALDGELRLTLARGGIDTAQFFSWPRVAAWMDAVLREAVSGAQP